MIIPIIYPSAIQFWMDSNLLNYSDSFSLEKRYPALLPDHYEFHPTSSVAAKISQQFGFTYPIHVMAPDIVSRRINNYFSSGLKPCHLPSDSFIEIDSFRIQSGDKSDIYSIYLASPELCFLEAAVHLSLIELIKLGYDLCAIYLTDTTADYHHTSRKIIATQQSIAAYLETMTNIKGIKKARTAIRHVLNRSNSPRETMLSMILTLPMSMGGYGIYKPELNERVQLSEQGSQILHRDYCICDIVWENKKIIVEYDSNLTHLNSTQHELDKARISALTLSGYQVITLTPANMRSLSDLDNICTALRWKLGLHKECARLNKYNEKRRALYKYLKEST
ncbi:MAG: hypothetical protein IJ106_13065 [Parasporobacterium sp.]|nr:hypothetical protein [Parasporobacterium sp.]